jgi:hypothetical protein
MIDNSREYVLCAAIWYKDGTEAPRGMIAQNISSGVVIGQWRHGNCITVRATNPLWNARKLAESRGEDSGNILTFEDTKKYFDEVDGFITSEGRFVDRWQAAELAILSGQISEERGLNADWIGDEEYMKDFQNQTPHYRGGEERNRCKYRMIYSEDLY